MNAVSLISLTFVLAKKMYGNTELVILLISIVLTYDFILPYRIYESTLTKVASSILSMAWPLSHWMVTYIYLKVIIEASALLDPSIYSNNEQKLRVVSQQK
jgi:hypothetical protein